MKTKELFGPEHGRAIRESTMTSGRYEGEKSNAFILSLLAILCIIFTAVGFGFYYAAKQHRATVMNIPFTPSTPETEIRYLVFKGDTVEVRKIVTNKYDYMNLDKSERADLLRMLKMK